MAQVILSPLLDFIVGNLASSALQELQLARGVDEELQKLKSTLSAIQAVLQDAEEKQFRFNAVRDWLQKLKYVAYEAEDLVDEIVTEAQQSKATESGNEAAAGKKKRKLQEYLGYVSSFFNRSERVMASRIREINAQLKQIAKERRDFHLETGHGGKQLEIIPRPPMSSVRDESSQVLGRIDDTKQIISFLLSDDSDKRKFSVIAIVGMGGVGKTTLAQVVYNDKSVTDNFKLRAWVCVSKDFDVERLTKEIITSITKSSCDLSDIDSLQCSLRDKLHGKKFLLVLDDVWSENGSDWERLRAPLTHGAKGSKIVVTTRNQAVSNAMQAATTHNLKCLSKQDCWSVFVNQAFNDGNANAYPELIKIGEELVKKCGGLPLAAKALGGLLSSKRQAKEWENILKNPIWSWRGPASNILPALRLSYQYLPAHLKRCFTFCSVFPKDYEFEEQQLILLWVAHGFIRPEEEKQIEDTASEYFNDLLLRSFFQLSSGYGRTTYKMHDLVHDLAQFMSSDECIQMEIGKSRGVHGKTQHLSYSVSRDELINFESFYESKGLRTFLLMTAFGRMVSQKVPHDMFERFRCIRVLDLSRSYITELPNPIGNLKHLRYLNLSNTRIKELPESICSIYNLQTLLLRGCTNLVRLPNEMRKLTNMRHLDLDGCSNIESMPPQIGRLTFLQTLPWFVVGRERESGIADLKELTNLRGKLVIKQLENATEAVHAREANLKDKPFIDRLSLEWSTGRSWSTQEEELVEGLRPHPSLKKLELDGYMGTHFPSWMHTCLSNLTALYLTNCRRCSILPPLGRLPFLSYLEIVGMDQVEQMGAEMGGGFPSLKEFRLCDMVKLEKWQVESGEVGVLLCLQSLDISNCPQLQKIQIPCSNLTKLSIAGCAKLVSLPRLPSLEGLELTNLNNLEEWCDVVGGEAHFPHLKSLKIVRCPKMRRWPGILPALTKLRISNCDGFNELPRLPSLEGLELRNLDNLEEWCDVVGGEAHFPHLKILNIDRCPKMRRWPDILPALTQLKISNCQGLNELPRLPSLEGLELTNLDNLEEWCDVVGGEAHFPHLKSLNIDRCPKLRRWPDILPALTQLKIWNCQGLNEFPRLPSLEGLELRNLDNLEKWCDVVGGEAHFPHLKSLNIDRCPKMRRWPDILPALTQLKIWNSEGFNELPRLPSLEGLELTNLNNLEEWCDVVGGEAHFPHLKSLNIDRCPKLRRWPGILPALTELRISDSEGFNELPRLPSLERLDLEISDNLEEWCDVVGGEAHFPHLKSLNIDRCPKMRRWPDILPALTQLKISTCQGLNELPRLPSLEGLELTNLDNLEEWCDVVGGEAHFPHLKSLKIDRCPKMRRWPDILPALTQLKIWNYEGLNELPRLPSLEGLELTNLNNLEEWCDVVGGEAHFPHLKSLNIVRCPKMRRWPGILPALTKLRISNCEGFNELPRLPSLEGLELRNLDNLEEWCDVVGGEAHFPHLKSLNIDRCPKMRRWPDILPALTQLKISNCQGLNELPWLPSLEALELTNLDNLEKWCDVVGGEAHFPHLKSLKIDRCPKMRRWPDILPALTQLKIWNYEGLNELPRLPSLVGLELRNLDNLEKWCDVVGGEAHFPHLKSLNIVRCPKMRRWPDILPALTQLKIWNSEGLNELPPLLPSSLSDLSLGGVISERLLNSVSCLTSLSSLDISDIPSRWPREILQAQTRLESLTIRGNDRLVTLEDEVLPSTLRSLSFRNCPNLKSLPRTLHALTSLRHLTIGSCPGVALLPEEGLPSSLEWLEIRGCPVLRERCLKDVGEDWPKISRIPRLKAYVR